MNNSPGEFNYHRTILLSLRRLNNATLNFPGRVSPDDVFGTNDIRSYMHEIVKIDPESLNITIRQFIQFINEVLTTEKIDIPQLREIFTERLIRTFTNLPGCSDDDDEWLNKNSETFPSSPLTFSSPKSKDLLLTSRPKIEPEIENPWVTKYNTSTEMPKEYKNYIGGITFLGIYEITRILKPFGPIEPTNKFWTQIICGSAIHEVLYEECKEYFDERSNSNSYSEMSKLINKNLSRVWTLSSKEFPRVGPRTHVIFSGDVVLKDRRLVLTLLPPKIGTSRRYYRMFSSEKFLQLKISTDIHSLDNRQKTKLKRLLLHPLPLAGRTYEFLYAKSDTLYYFATRGLDITKDISIKDVIDYNLPIELNKNDTTAKFYSRISLGFSNSTPTVIFKPNEILYDEADIKNETYCFTDGCSEISLGAMKEVAEILGYEETPSVIQGRIGGAKGTWYIEPTMEVSGRKWIKLRRSQTKYHVIDKDHLCTLEVLHVSVPPKSPATLNSQFIRILIEGGVPVGIFLDMVKNHIENLKSQVVGCDDPHSLITWVTNISNVMIKRIETYNNDSYDDIISKGDAISGFPNNPSEQCVQMLQAGFTPSTCPFLAKKLKCVLSSALKSLHNKFRIEVPLSRTLLCIADPTGTLESGEIFIQLDKEAGRDERTGLPFGIIENEVIIARNPATLPSDIMRVKAVKNVHLSMYYNVVVFPVKGEIPLASYLSGGDYDGDKIFCCWEPTIVDNFKNAEILPTHPGVENAFIQNKQTVDELLSSTIPDKVETKLQELILDFYFKDLEPTLGLYDRWHRLQSSKFGLSDELSIYLAQMCAKLVDATKQGLTIKPNVFQRDNDLFNDLPVPYWMDKDNKSRNRESHLGVMDLLHKSIESEMKKINNKDFLIAKFTKDPDPHIKEFWCNEYTRAEQMNGEERLAYREDLNLIYRSSLDIIAQYNKNYTKIFNDDREQRDFPFGQITKSTGSTSYLNDKFKGVDYEFIIKFLNTPSVEKYKSNIFKYLKYRGPLALDNLDPLTMFELQLKAAAIHLASIERKPTGQGCWIISFRLLCNIKSQMIDRFVVGGPRSIIDEVWQSMKIDKKWVKRYES